jgi:hypothetical protein
MVLYIYIYIYISYGPIQGPRMDLDPRCHSLGPHDVPAPPHPLYHASPLARATPLLARTAQGQRHHSLGLQEAHASVPPPVGATLGSRVHAAARWGARPPVKSHAISRRWPDPLPGVTLSVERGRKRDRMCLADGEEERWSGCVCRLGGESLWFLNIYIL